MAEYRWTWPESASALTGWMKSGELVALTADKSSTRGALGGRIISYRDAQGNRYAACVERRPSGEKESGKYQYRLLDLRSLTSYFAGIDLEPYTLIEHTVGLVITTSIPPGGVMPRMSVKTTYNPTLPELLKSLGGCWNKEWRQWEFTNEQQFDAVIEAMRDFYALGRGGRTYTLHVSVDAILPAMVSYQNAYLCERRVARRSAKWSRLMSGQKVWFVHPEDPEAMMLVIEDVPAGIYEAALEQLGPHIKHVDTYEPDARHDGAIDSFQKKAWGEALAARAYQLLHNTPDLTDIS